MINRYRLKRLFAPTKGLSRSLIALFAGVICFTLGSALSFRQALQPILEWIDAVASGALNRFVATDDLDVSTHILGGALLLLGAVWIFKGLRQALRQLIETINPGFKSGMADSYVRKQQLAQGPDIVVLGGGTGLSTLLRGLKHHTSNITAIVTVTDDGGSSGRLVADKGMIPPGDIRNCLVALADAEKSMTDLFQHRFKNDSGSLSGHSMGNLLIAALVDQSKGDFEKAVESASRVLAIRGRVVPSTLEHVHLEALMTDGRTLCGETNIVSAGVGISKLRIVPEDVPPHPEAIGAIMDCDLICVGPGSVYTSIIPNLLVPGIADAIAKSKALKVFVCNVMTQPGESDAFSASQHIKAVEDAVGQKLFDYVLVNTAVPSQPTLERYRGYGQHFVDPDADQIRLMGYKPVLEYLMSESDVIRHDPLKIASRLVALIK